MHAVYLACLFGGLAATVLFAVLGALGGVAGHAGHLHGGSTHTAHLPSHAPQHGHPTAAPRGAGTAPNGSAPAIPAWLTATFGWTLSWLSPLTLAAAALWFGGAGLIAEGVLPARIAAIALLIAVLAALAGAAVVRALMAALIRASTPPLRAEAVGALGTINAPIRADAAGEVIYTLEGLRRSTAARSVDGAPLPRGTAVVIVRRERGMAWVQPIDPLASLGPPAMSQTQDAER